MTVRLWECASLIRSKNAGPISLTMDVLFSYPAPYEHVKRTGVLTASRVAELYRVPADQVAAFACDQALAFKVSLPRPKTQGDFGDGDVHGGQQYAPLLDLEVPQR